MPSGPRVAVIGAGAFGGWTALELVHRGADVILIDAWGAGHARASSGGDTRIIRSVYGSRDIYTTMAARALELWRAYDRCWQADLLRITGGLWIFGQENDGFARASAAALETAGRDFEWLSPADASARYPQVDTRDVAILLYEPDAGYLFARRACEHVAARVAAAGGTVRIGAVRPPATSAGRLHRLTLDDDTSVNADVFVFACGPWLGRVFPDVVGDLVTPTRQEIYYFGTPAGDRRFSDTDLPVWIELGETLLYGIPDAGTRGFKIADDTPGPRFDPTNGSRELTASGIDHVRQFLGRRFPALREAPLLGGEVCQYEATPDAHFIVDVHPEASNVWLVGGGSGHGFKMGPVMGEIVAAAALGERPPDPTFALSRFSRSGGELVQEKWR
jgi:glycine/D-amino acid oxidase-like deaminating enzyme